MADSKGAGGSDRKTLIEEGTRFKGSLTSSCAVVVRGAVEGDVSAPSLTVSPSGAVHGTVKVGDLKSEGELAGEFDADTVLLSGSVKDNTVIRAKSLEVKLAPAQGKMQVIFGECAIDVGETTTKEAAIAGTSNNASAEKKVPSVAPPAGSAE